jgi:hypothetical protein
LNSKTPNEERNEPILIHNDTDFTLRQAGHPDRPALDGQDYIVLNSVSNLSKALRLLGNYERIHCFLDNDRAGLEALREIQREYGSRVRDASPV